MFSLQPDLDLCSLANALNQRGSWNTFTAELLRQNAPPPYHDITQRNHSTNRETTATSQRVTQCGSRAFLEPCSCMTLSPQVRRRMQETERHSNQHFETSREHCDTAGAFQTFSWQTSRGQGRAALSHRLGIIRPTNSAHGECHWLAKYNEHLQSKHASNIRVRQVFTCSIGRIVAEKTKIRRVTQQFGTRQKHVSRNQRKQDNEKTCVSQPTGTRLKKKCVLQPNGNITRNSLAQTWKCTDKEKRSTSIVFEPETRWEEFST